MTDHSNRSGSAMLTAARLWRKTSAKCIDYLTGRLGGVRMVVMPKRDGDHSHIPLFADVPQRNWGGR